MHGPQTITLSAAEIEQQVEADFGGVVAMFDGRAESRPDVSLLPASERLLLEWTFKLQDAPAGPPVGIAVALSGKPVLDAARTGIDLTQVRIEDVRLPGLARFLSLSRLVDRKEMTLPDLPLMTLPHDLLHRSGVAYEATGVSVGFRGLAIDIVPR